jgi:NADP-dependent 3-hydroxy acid dehydrogenase YdfG
MLMQFLSPETEFWEIPVFEVNNQHILVTGSSSGLGRRALLRQRRQVTLAARRANALASVFETSTTPAAERKALCSTSRRRQD